MKKLIDVIRKAEQLKAQLLNSSAPLGKNDVMRIEAQIEVLEYIINNEKLLMEEMEDELNQFVQEGKEMDPNAPENLQIAKEGALEILNWILDIKTEPDKGKKKVGKK